MRWTTMGLSAGTQAALAREPEPKPVDWKKRIASVWIPAILGLGLLMAFAYLGVRIVAGKSQAGPTTKAAKTDAPLIPSATAQEPAKINPPKTAPQPALTTIKATDFTVVTPQAGERFLQVAAVSPHMVLTYVDDLLKAGWDPVVAPGPTPDLLRVLVGPFPNGDSMDKAKAQLQAAGRSPIVRSY